MTTEVTTKELTPVEQARAEVGKLLKAEVDIVTRYMEVREQLPSARECAADAILANLLDGKGASKSGGQLAMLEAELSSLQAAEVACQRRRIEAIKNVWHLEAESQREKPQGYLKRPMVWTGKLSPILKLWPKSGEFNPQLPYCTRLLE
jgi:hypothetical protein